MLIISSTSCSSVVVGVHPSFSLALVGSPSRSPLPRDGNNADLCAITMAQCALAGFPDLRLPIAVCPSRGPGRRAQGSGAPIPAAGGDYKVFRDVLLEHSPLHLHVVAGVAPVA